MGHAWGGFGVGKKVGGGGDYLRKYAKIATVIAAMPRYLRSRGQYVRYSM